MNSFNASLAELLLYEAGFIVIEEIISIKQVSNTSMEYFFYYFVLRNWGTKLYNSNF